MGSGSVGKGAAAKEHGFLMTPSAILASSVGPAADAVVLTANQAQPLVREALRRGRSAGNDLSALPAFDIRIADLGGTTLGLASGNTIWLDGNAAGWGWFVDPTPWDDAEFTTPGDQGEQHHMDLLSVLTHEIGHLLGYEHDQKGVMQETLSAGERLTMDGDTVDAFWSLIDLTDVTKKRDPFGGWL